MKLVARLLATAAIGSSLLLAGCGGPEPGPQETSAPVTGGETTTFAVTSPRLGPEGWKAMSAYRELITAVGGRDRSLAQANKLYAEQGACLTLAGVDEQAQAVRRSCVADFAFGKRRVAINDCLTKRGGGKNECLAAALRNSSLAAQKATTSATNLADTLQDGQCRDLFLDWGEQNRLLAIALTDVRETVVNDDSVIGASRKALAAADRVSRRSGLGGVDRLIEACKPVEAATP